MSSWNVSHICKLISKSLSVNVFGTTKAIKSIIIYIFELLSMKWIGNWPGKVKHCRHLIDKQNSKCETENYREKPLLVANISSVQSYPFLSPILRHETGAVILRPGHRAGPGQW